MRAVALAVSAFLGLLAVPATATAAENLPPDQPLTTELALDLDTPCVAGDARPYTSDPTPRLLAVIRDPADAQWLGLRAEFEVSWTDANGERQVLTRLTSAALSSGQRATWDQIEGLPAGTVLSWRVRGYDGVLWGPWSSDNGAGACEFVIDTVNPEQPVVTSEQFPADVFWVDGVGVWGDFTVDSPSEDVVSYEYHFTGEPWHRISPDELGGPVEFSWMPQDSGPTTLEVWAKDRSGRHSATTYYDMNIGQPRRPVARWQLADPAGSSTAADDQGAAPATAGKGVTFGAEPPSGTEVPGAVELDGGSGAYLTPKASVVDPGRTFSVSAWVRPASLGSDTVAVSQNGADEPAFTLGTFTDGTGAKHWAFAVGDGQAEPAFRAVGGTPDEGEWAHLAGVYDAVTKTVRLYVNGRAVDSVEGAEVTPVSGDLQIGRSRDEDGYGHTFRGELAQVGLWDRVLVGKEIGYAAARTAERTAYWQVNTAANGESPEYGGGAPLVLGGDTSVFDKPTEPEECDWDVDPWCEPQPAITPLVGKGDLIFDGDGDYAATGGPVVATDQSYTLAAHVRLPRFPERDMSVLSVPGVHANAVEVRYDSALRKWQAVVAHEDAADAERTVVTSSDGSPVTHVAVVYDDGADEIRLYLGGYLAGRAHVSDDHEWAADGTLQLGRSLTAAGWGGFLDGHLDEVRVYQGAVKDSVLLSLSSRTERQDL
ncbi:LamG domain-containing protein [Streptomyces sp. NPDC051940]|uniref:LamG domain-containing protein n=1 Tax=Streptomyces sp. NPDC051940 TaxID=3155675 RepID=UPI003426633B